MAAFEKDRGYAWVILIAAFLTNMMVAGMIICPSLFLVEWYTSFGSSKSNTAWTVAIMNGFRQFSGVFTGTLVNQFGCQKVLFVGSVITSCALVSCAFAPHLTALYFQAAIAGCGISLMASPPIVIIYDYFDKYKFLASGMSMMGHSLSAFFMIALCRISIDHYGWRGAMFILAGVMLNGCVMAMLMVPISTSVQRKSHSLRDMFNIDIFRNASYVFYAISMALHIGVISSYYNFTPSRAVTKGMTKLQASYLPTLGGIASATGRFIISWISNLPCTSHIGLSMVSIFMMAVLMMISCIKADSFLYAAIFCALLGVQIGISTTLIPAIYIDFVGKEKLASAIGWGFMFTGIQAFITLPIGGYIYDVTGDFNMSFYTMGTVGIVAGLLSAVSTYIYHTREKDVVVVETKPPEETGVTLVLRTRAETVTADDFGSQILIPDDSKISS